MKEEKGKIRIINEDCANERVLEKIKDGEIDIIFTSPPYNMGKNAKKYRDDSDAKENWKDWLKEIILKWLPKCQYFFLNLQSLTPNKIDIIELIYELREFFVDRIIWNKERGFNSPQKNFMMPVFEDIYIFSVKGNKSRASGTKDFPGSSVKNLVTVSKRDKKDPSHKAIFALDLAKFIFENFAKENATVADIFLGTGTCAVAALELNMNFIGVEKDEFYYKISKERIEKRLKEIKDELK